MSFEVACTLEQVLEAWELVYETYRRVGLIDPNCHGVHVVPHAVSQETLVILGRDSSGRAVNTISAYADGEAGLCLDEVYKHELDGLRRQGRRLVEVGMLADRTGSRSQALDGILNLMRFPYYFTMHSGWDDLVIGVHPHHARFYQQAFGFEQIGPVRTYPMVKDHLVVLLRLDVAEGWNAAEGYKCARYVKGNPLSPGWFADRFRFEPELIEGTALAAWGEVLHNAA